MNLEKQVEQDYGFALLTSLWVTRNEKNYLIFGALEFYPLEIDECSEIKRCSILLDSKDSSADIQLNFSRIKISCADALKLYDSCRETGSFVLPCDSAEILMQEDGDSHPIELSQWPNLSVDRRSEENLCPFLAESWGCCRMHQLLPQNISAQILMIAEYEKPIQWMKDRLLWDISMYPELLGSMHLILPDPLIRSVSERLVPGSPSSVIVCLVLRQRKSLADLNNAVFVAIERGTFGIRSVQKRELSTLENPSFTVKLSGISAEDFSTAIYDATRGLLEWSAFGNFIMGFDIDMRVANAKRKILSPDNKSSYEVTVYEKFGKIESSKSDDSWGMRLHLQQLKRAQGKYAKKYGQHLFKAETSEAAEVFIRELIQQAKERVIIVDPFFATLELFKYVLGIPSPVDITIITGNEIMKDNSKYSGGEEKILSIGQEILRQIKVFQKKVNGYTIQVKVMTGDNIIHDRFLILDNQVWFSGNSLNKIGSRASMLIRLPNPQEVLDYLDEVQNDSFKVGKRIIKLEEWLQERERTHNGKKQSEA